MLIYLRSEGGAGIAEAYRQTDWARPGIPGLLRSELVRDTSDADWFTLISEWAGLADFQAWQDGPEHRGRPSALAPYKDRTRGAHYLVYEVVEPGPAT